MLESLIAPKDHAWRPGELRHKPSGVPMASFAYSHGVKSMEVALGDANYSGYTKARYRHVLDMARIGLVFQNCDFLQDALDLILSQFEVVDVRNKFRTACRTGERFVEVLLILEVETEDGQMPHVCEVRLEEINFYNARARAEPVMQELLGKTPGCKAVDNSRAGDPSDEPQAPKHISRRFGSALGAWRRFRNLCKEVKCWKHSTEYWQELDVGRAGCISLFEMDSASVCILAAGVHFALRLLKLANIPSEEATAEELTFILTRALGFSATEAGIHNKESRSANEANMKCYFFSHDIARHSLELAEATNIFDLLDADGGHTFNPPGRVRLADIAWLVKLPTLVDLSVQSFDGLTNAKAVALRPDGFNGQETIPEVAWTPKRPSGPSAGASPSSDLPYQRANPGSPTSPMSPNFLQSYGDLGEEGEDGEEAEVVAPPAAAPRRASPPSNTSSVPTPAETPSQMATPAQTPSQTATPVETPSQVATPAETPPQQRKSSESQSSVTASLPVAAPTPDPPQTPTPASSEERQPDSKPWKWKRKSAGASGEPAARASVQKSVTLDVEPHVQDDNDDYGDDAEDFDGADVYEIDGRSDGHDEAEEDDEVDTPKSLGSCLARQLAQCQWKVASRCAAKGFSVTADYFQRAYRASSSSVAKYRVEANIS
ncbi:hypothetical protein AK812_SmicGene11207 [Symbiodinium microadriaticum]|uniref:Uncharacterized protein n=1 Tax=Symbiodinium microadriaticum TaxID=2951 RepID=A0A1Q9EDU7_SYMMI|nr:hypothetical protein AK812_SmicGene11207 [Symbiodinium microadriaticum]